MAWSYKRLWHLLVDKEMKKTDLITFAGLNSRALANMGRDLPVAMDNLEKICRTLHCRIEDIVEYVPDEEMNRKS